MSPVCSTAWLFRGACALGLCWSLLGACADRASRRGDGGTNAAGGARVADAKATVVMTDDGGDAGGRPRDAGDAASAPDARAPLHSVAYPTITFPTANPFTAAKALLGKVLFWDEQLSADDSVACGTCHRPAAGGSDPRPTAAGFVGHPGPDGKRGTDDDPRGSPGVRRCARADDGSMQPVDDAAFGRQVQVTRRRPMSFIDAMFWPELFWDGRARGAFADPLQPDQILIAAGGALESQAVGPLQNATEMTCEGFAWSDLTAKLGHVTPLARAWAVPRELSAEVRRAGSYPALFDAAFGSPEIEPARIAFAIATYERGLASDQTPWDQWNAGDQAALSESQNRGAALFGGLAGCACCHPPPLFGAPVYGNDGLSSSTWDQGRYEVTKRETDRATFRIPSLRNVGLRQAGGLLHDGVGAGMDLTTLVHRYNEAPLVAMRIGICQRQAINLSEEQLADLAEFVRNGLTDPRVAEERAPFDRPHLASERP
jgi:cytochrome c peroxidase